MSEQQVPEFEDRLRTLLARTAEAIPANTDISARVRQAQARDTRVTITGGVGGLRHGLATVAAVLVVALLAGLLIFARPGGFLPPTGGVTGTSTSTATTAPTQVVVPPNCGPDGPANPPPPVGTPVDHSVAIGRHASLNGITITIDRAYADATQTVITYHMQTNVNPPLPALPVLIDAQGHRYAAVSGGWSAKYGAHLIFSPLPPEELGISQQLTFFTRQMQPADSTAPGTLVDGPWQIPFSLTPAKGISVALSNMPLTRNGLTVQPLRLDVAPAGGGLDSATGGVRVVVRLSGLAPGLHLSDLLNNFHTDFRLGNESSGGGGCGIVELVLPNGQQIMPGFVDPLGWTAPTTPAEQQAAGAETVGSTGTVDLEALFYAPIPAGTSLTLYVDHVAAQIAGTGKPTPISGPWEFRLQPSA